MALLGQEKYDSLMSLLDNDHEPLKQLSDEELIAQYKESILQKDFFSMMQLVAKLLCNSVYGGFGTPSLRYYENAVAADITGEGRWSCKLTDIKANKWFEDEWPTDIEWFNTLKSKFPDIIPQNLTAPKPIHKDICIYCDTDSVVGSTELTTPEGKITIESLFNTSERSRVDINGNEFAKTDKLLLNYTEDNKLYYAKVKNVIRHKVTKAKWKLKTKSGKEIIVTNDHSMVVFRNGEQLTVKPSEILHTDKILTVKNDR